MWRQNQEPKPIVLSFPVRTPWATWHLSQKAQTSNVLLYPPKYPAEIHVPWRLELARALCNGCLLTGPAPRPGTPHHDLQLPVQGIRSTE